MTEEPNTGCEEASAVRLACAVLRAYVRKNPLPAADVPAALRSFYGTLATLATVSDALPPAMKPAVPIKKSVRSEYIICLEDGRKLKMLKRYLRTRYGLTPEEYRAKWRLPSTYPMTAPKYAAVRSGLAKKIGLGRKARKASPSTRRP
jgi:predicted transcriptional regulator